MISTIQKLSVIVLFAGMLMVCTSGCLYMMNPFEIRSLSFGESPFDELKHTTQTLKRPIRIVYYPERSVQSDTVEFWVDNIAVRPEDICQYPKELPSETPICFDHNSFHVAKYYRFFFIPWRIRYQVSFYIKGHSPEDRYTYIWGRGRYLHHAPWENDDIPEWRYVGFNGRSYKPDKEKK